VELDGALGDPPTGFGLVLGAAALSVAAPAGFEGYFRELSDMGGAQEADPQALGELAARYGLEIRPESIPELLERFDLRVGEALA
jgi:hypothetical protein